MDEGRTKLPKLESKVVNYLWCLSSASSAILHGDISPSD